MKKILLGLLMIGTLFGQVNRVLTISPTTSETILGNQSLAFRNPAMNLLNTDYTLIMVHKILQMMQVLLVVLLHQIQLLHLLVGELTYYIKVKKLIVSL